MSKPFSILCDLDGVIHRASRPIPGAAKFVAALQKSGRTFVFLTNSPDRSPHDLQVQLKRLGIDVEESCFYTSAQAIAAFLKCRSKCPKVYLIGSPALREELKKQKVVFTTRRPDFVVFATGSRYTQDDIDQAIQCVMDGANLISANREAKALTEHGIKAGCGALVAPIEKATQQTAYVIGKPNHFMIRQVEEHWGVSPTETIMIGDSLETDIDVGLQAQMKTVLVLSGHTTQDLLFRSPYKPDYVFKSVAQINLNRLP